MVRLHLRSGDVDDDDRMDGLLDQIDFGRATPAALGIDAAAAWRQRWEERKKEGHLQEVRKVLPPTLSHSRTLNSTLDPLDTSLQPPRLLFRVSRESITLLLFSRCIKPPHAIESTHSTAGQIGDPDVMAGRAG